MQWKANQALPQGLYYIRGSTPFHSCVEVRLPKLVSREDRTGARAPSAAYCSTEGVAPLHTATSAGTLRHQCQYTAPPVPVLCATSAGTMRHQCRYTSPPNLPIFSDCSTRLISQISFTFTSLILSGKIRQLASKKWILCFFHCDYMFKSNLTVRKMYWKKHKTKDLCWLKLKNHFGSIYIVQNSEKEIYFFWQCNFSPFYVKSFKILAEIQLERNPEISTWSKVKSQKIAVRSDYKKIKNRNRFLLVNC